jgi:hypothetical protein
MIEEYKPIPNFPNYEISNNGILINKYGKILKPFFDKDGYLLYTLYNNGKKNNISQHRLLAMLFLSDFDKNLQVDHIDRNESNNNLSNLY